MMDSLTLVDVNKICRFCLSLTNEIVVSIFSSAIAFMVKKLDILKLDLEYNMPSSICQSCVYRLMESYNFKQQIETSECRLRDFYAHNTVSQFPYLNASDRIEDDNASFSSQFPPLLAQQYDTFSAMNTVCDIFESNNSEDIEVADVEIDVSSLTRSEDEETIHDQILDIEENHKIIVDFPETLDYIENSDILKIENNNNIKNENINIENIDDLSSIKISNSTEILKDNSQKGRIKKLPKIRPKCPECGKTCPSLSHLEIHQRTHNGVKPFICEICNKSFAQVGNFTLHLRMHRGEKRYQCEICSKLFSTSSNLKAHIYAHTDERKYKCLKCDRLFKAKIQLNRHIATHSTKEFQCHLCNKLFLTKTYLRVHFESVHEKKKKFKCNDCHQKFSSSSNWKMHCRIHTGEKPFVCKHCKATFNQSSSLVRHLKTHSKISDTTNVEKKTLIETHIDFSTNNNELPIINNSRENMIISEYLPTEIINSNSNLETKNIELSTTQLWSNFDKGNII